jgi:hypothetical protein
VKALKVVSAELGVAVAATKRRYRVLSSLAMILTLLFGYQNCAVDNSMSTPGASSNSCAPTASVLATFEPLMKDNLQSTSALPSGARHCGSCHADATNPASAAFKIFPDDPATTPGVTTANYCALQSRGKDMLLGKILGPSPHSGGHYTESEIQGFIDFLRTSL